MNKDRHLLAGILQILRQRTLHIDARRKNNLVDSVFFAASFDSRTPRYGRWRDSAGIKPRKEQLLHQREVAPARGVFLADDLAHRHRLFAEKRHYAEKLRGSIKRPVCGTLRRRLREKSLDRIDIDIE